MQVVPLFVQSAQVPPVVPHAMSWVPCEQMVLPTQQPWQVDGPQLPTGAPHPPRKQNWLQKMHRSPFAPQNPAGGATGLEGFPGGRHVPSGWQQPVQVAGPHPPSVGWLPPLDGPTSRFGSATSGIPGGVWPSGGATVVESMPGESLKKDAST